MKHFFYLTFVSSVMLFSVSVLSMEGGDDSAPPPEFVWLMAQPEFLSFSKDMTEEKAVAIVDEFYRAGFDKKWQYFWQSDDDIEKKKIQAESFYKDTKEYWIKKDQVKELSLLARINLIMGWAMNKTSDNRQLKNIYQTSRQNPLARMHALNQMSDRVLNENEDVLDKKIATVFEHIWQLLLCDIKEIKKNMDATSLKN